MYNDTDNKRKKQTIPKWEHYRITKDGDILPRMTLENTQIALNHFKERVQLNAMTNKIEWSKDCLTRFKSDCRSVGYGTEDLIDHVQYIAEKDQYHPVLDWITSKSWDGSDRLTELLETLTIKNGEDKIQFKQTQVSKTSFCQHLITKWLVSAVSMIADINPPASHGVLVLQGGQGIGKTRWLKSLCNSVEGAVMDGVAFDATSVDSVRQTTAHWIVELGELDATFKKSDIAALKAHITRSSDEYRIPYATDSVIRKRRTVYAASVNKSSYLVDDTGNRRYWTIAVDSINHDHCIDMQQVWAQVLHIKSNCSITSFLDSDEIKALALLNEEHEEIKPLSELLLDYYPIDAERVERVSATSIAERLLDDVSKRTVNDLTSCLRALGFAEVKSSGKRLFVMPKIKI